MFIYGTQIHKVPVVFFVLSSNCQKTKLVFYYMWVISFKIINKHSLNLIQKACVMIDVIRTKTHRIMLEAIIWPQVVY